MRIPLTPACSGATVVARFVHICLLLVLSACGGSSPHMSISTPPGPPAIAALSPTAGVPGLSVKISGSNFGSAPGTVTFNGTSASVVNWTDSLIIAKAPSGATTGNVVVTVGGNASNGLNFTVVALPTGSIALSNFGFQCGPGDTADCEGSTQGSIIWPTTQAQPGMLRLHDAGTQWAVIDPVGGGKYNWAELDQWLDLIATHQPLAVSQVFTWVPCWDAATCSSPPTAPAGTNAPPLDLPPTTGPSPAFNNFVTAFVTHCNSNNHCVKDLIHYYEMWNEWDLQFHWTGTMAQVYQMLAPAVTIIKNNDPNAIIMTPSTTPASDTGLGYQADFQNWLNYENAHGRISDWVAWHNYLTATDTTTNTPEDQWTKFNVNFLSIQAITTGWINTPWANTETNFNGAPPPTGLNYTCPTSSSPTPPITFNANDCTGQIVRWQLLHDSNGAVGVFWYKWNETIGANLQYETAYYNMMQYLVGGKFNGPCAAAGTIWTCSFTEANVTSALWVWTPNESGTSFTVPSGYIDYRDLSGGTTSVSAGQQITIGTEPFMLEQ